MKKISWLFVLALMLIMGTSFASAERITLTAGSGAKGGTYFSVVSDMATYCNSSTFEIVHYTEKNPETKLDELVGGSINNMRNLLNNRITFGPIQSDIVQLEKLKKREELNRILGFLPLHQEQLHFIVPVTANVLVRAAKKGTLGFGGSEAIYQNKENPLKNIEQLPSHKMATWGGSTKTGEIVRTFTEIGYEIEEVKDSAAAIAKLDSGEVSAILAVVGAPAKWIEALPKGKYKLLSVTKETQKKLKDVYGVAVVSYDNLGKTGQTIEALTVDSDIYTRTYRLPEIVNALTELQNCVRKKIVYIQDKQGTHPVWQSIDPNRKIDWDKIFNGK